MFTLNDLLQGNRDTVHFAGTTKPPGEMSFHAAHHDSRQIGPGDLFIAIKGEHVDGHSYIPQVARAGALAALCNEPSDNVPPTFLQIITPDVVKALHATARVRAQRQQNTTFIGITGSNGKTSTKEAIATVLSRHAPTLKTQDSYNNEIGYPLTLLRLEPQHRYAVLEMGAQWVGELSWLSNTIARPDWSVITNVGASHLEFFGSQERVAIAKAELVEVLTEEGIAILNYDDANVRAMHAKTRARVLFYGRTTEAQIQARDIAGDTLLGRSFTLRCNAEEQRVQLRLPGEHGVTIALAAAAVGHAAAIELSEIVKGLEALSPAPGRGEIKRGPNGSTVIDDTFNANRQSIIAITQAMHDTALPPTGRRWAILSGIVELGPYSRAEHQAAGAAVAGTMDYLVAIGDTARYYVEGAIAAGMPEDRVHYYYADPGNIPEMEAAKAEAAELLRRNVREDDLLLLKGSRKMHMETMLPMFEKEQTR